MKTVTIDAAAANLSELIEQAAANDEILLMRGNTAVAKIVKLPPRRSGKRVFGRYRGQFTVPPEFFDPLPDEELAAWER